jgi:hypothetical protein
MSVKVKSLSRGQIDTRTHKKHAIDTSVAELLADLKHVEVQQSLTASDVKLSTEVPVSSNLETVAQKLSTPEVSVSLSDRPVKGEHNSIIWGKTMPKPRTITGIIRQIEGLFNVGTEVNGWAVAYFPPPVRSKNEKCSIREMTIPQAPMAVAARYILCLGSKEILRLQTVQGNAEGKILLAANQAVNFPIGLCSQCTFTVNNLGSELIEPRPGFRQVKVSKQLHDRHILVLDGYVNVSSLTDKIRKEAKNATSTAKDADQLASKFSTMIGELNDVDSVVNSASKLGAQEPLLTKPKSAQSAAVVDFPPAATPCDLAQSPDIDGDISPAPTALSPLVCLDEQCCIVEPLST